MKIKRRLLAALAAMAIVANQSLLPIYAEETTTSETTSETTTTSTSADTTQATSDSSETTTSSSTEDTTEPTTEGTTTNPTEVSTTSENTSETTETSHEQVSPDMPSLDFSIQDAWQWKKDTADWELSYNADTTDLYYKVSSDYIDTSNGYTDGIAWGGFEQLGDGDYWIVFWAVDKENPELVTQSNQLEYKLDRTGISRFTIKKEDGKETPQHTKELIVSNIDPILVSASGIKDNQIKYSIESNGQIQDHYLTVNGEDKQVTLVNGILNFNISLTTSYENATITVIIEDGVGNIETAQLNGVSHDSVVPVVASIDFVYPTFNDDDTDRKHPTWHDLEALPFGDDRLAPPNNRTEYTYVSDESFLKVKIEDDFKDLTIKATINDKTIDYNADDLLAVDGDYSTTNGNDGTFYIPLKDSDFDLEAGKLYTVSVSAVDSKNPGNTIIAEDTVFYDPYRESDSTISNPVVSGNSNTRLNGSYSYLGLDPQYDKYDAIFRNAGTATNSISVTMQDDVGLAEYEIVIECNGSSTVVTGAYYEGIERTTEIITTTVVTDENNNESTETSKTEVKYNTQATEPVTEKILLSEDGDYKITITVIDLAGNVRKMPLRYYVDTKAPSIQDPSGKFTYTVEQGMLNYFTFGIFGSETIRISVPVTENGTEIKAACLYWAPETDSELAEYKGESVEDNGNWRIVFNDLPTSDVKLSAVPKIVITDSFDNTNEYYFQTPDERALVNANAEGIEGAVLVLEKNPPIIKMTPSGDNLDVIDEKLFFGDATNSKLSFELIDSDDTGILKYSLIIKNQMEQVVYSENDDYTNLYKEAQDAQSDDEESDTITIPIQKVTVDVLLDEWETGEYTLEVSVTDVSGNTTDTNHLIHPSRSEDFDVTKFYIDKTAPVVDDVQYTVRSSMLKYFTFGIFGNETISISVNLSDNEFGSEIDNATLWWGNPIVLNGHGNGEYVYEGLSPDGEFTPYITITDKMGNESTYYFATVDRESKESDIGELILDGETNAIILMLEDNIEAPVISVPEAYNVNGEIWYPSGIEYKVSITDKDSGLNKVVVTENDKTTTENGVRNGKPFEEERYVTEAEFTYQLNDANHYDIGATAYDNAGNVSETANKTIHIDLENPNITHFEFGGQDGNGSAGPKITTYGYFFQQDTEARVYVDDPGVSSGIQSVQLWLEGVEGSSYSGDTTVNSSSQDPNQPSYFNPTEGYAKFTIPMGFKGKVYAEVIDNVEHTSGVINADGNIVEDADIHARTSSIDIHEDADTDKTDAAQIPLYNRNIPLTITVKDTFSGISTIEWSIANDNESGTISVSPSGEINGNGVNIGDTETDSNLVTSIQFTLSVDDNSNGNIVKIVLTDRSGNISEASKTYSIDTTAPSVTAGIANGTAHNGSYYDSDLTVNIAITERNFNGGDVQITLNGNTQTVQWDDDGSTVGQDGTVHHASFPINGDGDYTYSVSYTDRAGNPGNTVSSDKFTIDKKAPEATITFDVGDDTKDDAYYNSVRTATFNVTEHNYGSAVIKITKDGTDVSGNYELNNWKPNDHSGDNHTQSVTLKEESGYYQVSITVTDKAGNTFQTSSKKFYIDLAAPEVHINVDNVKNGAPSNEKTITPSISIIDHERNLDPESISLKVTVVKLTDENEIKSFTVLDYHGLSAWKDGEGSIKMDNENSPNEISFDMNNLEEDGIYTITVSASDLAGNTGGQSSEDKQNGSEYKLSVNRLGSTYEVDDIIVSKDPELRYYQNSDGSPFSFTITEYNVNTLNPTDTIVKITCDGNVVDNQIKATEETGDNTWSIYTYEFPAELFENSGKYIIKLYSVDAAGNENPLEINGDDERATVTFFIDNISPEVHFRDADDKTEFTNEDPYRTDLKHIEVEVYDNSMQEAQDVVFKLNGEELTANHDAGSMIYTFDIPSKTSLQTLNMTLKDIAGNETDTGVDDFLITTNVFILWFKNTPLFIGTILALLAAIGGIVFAVVRKKPRGFN